MRPLSLTLNGFTSYGEETSVYLEPVTLAAITGSNGSGKSSLIDAITFALYGKGRVDGDLDAIVNSDCDQATVTFEFMLNDAPWRVTRTRVRGKRSVALLESTDDNGMWTARSSGAVRETDAAIRELLGMSMDTFLATVIVGQGDADRFTSADPAARKEVLGEVLDLGRYGRWADAAKARLSDVRVSVKAADVQAESLANRVAGLGDAETELARATVALDAATTAESDARSALERAVDAAAESVTAEADLADAETAVRSARQIVDERKADTAARLDQAKSRLARAQNTADKLRSDLDTAVTAGETAATLTAETDDLRSRLETLTESAETLVADGQAAKDVQVRLEAEVASLGDRLVEMDERREGVVKAAESGDATCWVCDQDLSSDHAHTTLERLDAQITQTRDLKETRESEAGEAARRTDQLRIEFKSVRDEQKTADARLTVLVGQVAELSATARQIDGIRDRLVDADDDVSDASRAVTEAQKLVDDAADDSTVAAAEQEVARLKALVSQAAPLRDAVTQAERTLTAKTAALKECQRQIGIYTERVQVLRDAAQELEDLNASMSNLRRDESDWATAARAFGRDGIPAMVVASAVPELEDQANQVLDDLSQGSLRLELSTTRELKSGATKETLDITIIGPDGRRAYDSYSGGERLRIDIAIRLGMSQMLANRSGTQIKMLIIDEGWGPLDTDGVPALIECLRALQESGRFESVFTVTHIGEVAASFPQQVNVTRGADNYSMVELAV